MTGISSPGNSYSVEEFAHFHFHQFQKLFIVDHVNFVEEDDDAGHADLTGQQDVLPGLGHGAVGGRYYQNGAVHLSSTGDHVFDVVGVTGAVNVGIVPLFRFVLDVGSGNGDSPCLLFRRLVDGIKGPGFRQSPLCQYICNGSGQCGFAVVNVTDGANVDVGLGAFKFLLLPTLLILLIENYINHNLL